MNKGKMTKEEFLIQYVLNRANTAGDLDGYMATKQALIAWNTIQSEVLPDKIREKDGKI